mmetsp:Transcript_12626/g.15373  ORF Transcript_12626/g.15373 Transcript_12626/m.15373 type:complete len:624 (+) Transcript_12626:106-1977(+)
MFHRHVTLASFALLMKSQFLKGADSAFTPGEDEVTLLRAGRGINCAPGHDFNKEECIAAAQSVGGELREGRFLVGDWGNTPPGCFIEASDKAIHYGRNGGGVNNGYFQSVCFAADDEVTVLDAYKGSQCSAGHAGFSEEECVAAAMSIGGVLENDVLKVGEWSHAPYGCSIQESDKTIHFGTSIEGINDGDFQPVCVAGTDQGIKLRATKGSSCDSGYDFNEADCVEAALSIGGKLRNGKTIVGAWGDAPNACFLEKSDKAIHYNNNQGGINNGGYHPICKVGTIKATLLPAYQGNACDPGNEIALEDCVSSAAAIGGKLRGGVFRIGEYENGPPGCFVENSDKAIHFGTSKGYNNGYFQPVCVAGPIEASVLQDLKGTKCTPGFDFTELECIEAATAVGGILRKNKFLVGDWANTPNACFIEARDKAIHYGRNQGAVNNGYFHPICKPEKIEAVLKSRYIRDDCKKGHDFSEQECLAAGKSVGGSLSWNKQFRRGYWSNAPFGCFVLDGRVMYGYYHRWYVNYNSYVYRRSQSVCKVEAEEATLLPASKGAKCSPGREFSKEECIAAAQSVGGKLRNDKFLVGDWAYAPYGCFTETRDGAIHFGTNVGSVNNGNYQPVCIHG